jgi:hypothetical protein
MTRKGHPLFFNGLKMDKYPVIITPDMLSQWSEISDEQLQQDILETEQELADEYHKLKAELELAQCHDPMIRRMNQFKADSRPTLIKEMEDFIAFLKRIQRVRKTSQENSAFSKAMQDHTHKLEPLIIEDGPLFCSNCGRHFWEDEEDDCGSCSCGQVTFGGNQYCESCLKGESL